jgi:hypothetical protein
MTRRTALALCCTGLLSVAAFAGDTAAKSAACCAKKKATTTTAEKAGKLRCSLTGKQMDKCCCEPREGGKMYCPLAKQEVDKCCCTEVKVKTTQAK